MKAKPRRTNKRAQRTKRTDLSGLRAFDACALTRQDKQQTTMPNNNKDRTLHISMEQYQRMDEDNVGICRECQAEREQTEPDAENYLCEECGQHAVDGVMNWLMHGHIVIVG